MRKFIALLLVFTFSILIVGCASDQDTVTSDSAVETAFTEATETTIKSDNTTTETISDTEASTTSTTFDGKVYVKNESSLS